MLLRAGATALALAAPRNSLAQSVDVRGRGYDPLWRDAEDAIASFLGPGPYLRTGARLTTPDHVDSGASVPISVQIESAMNASEMTVFRRFTSGLGAMYGSCRSHTYSVTDEFSTEV